MPNSDLKGKYFVCRPEIVEKIKTGLASHKSDEKGYNRGMNTVKNPRLTYERMKGLKHFFDEYDEKSKTGNASDEEKNEFKLAGGELMMKWINNTLGSSRDAIYYEKKSRMDADEENQFLATHEKDKSANPTKIRIPKISGKSRNIMSGNPDYVILGGVKEEINLIKYLIEYMNK